MKLKLIGIKNAQIKKPENLKFGLLRWVLFYCSLVFYRFFSLDICIYFQTY